MPIQRLNWVFLSLLFLITACGAKVIKIPRPLLGSVTGSGTHLGDHTGNTGIQTGISGETSGNGSSGESDHVETDTSGDDVDSGDDAPTGNSNNAGNNGSSGTSGNGSVLNPDGEDKGCGGDLLKEKNPITNNCWCKAGHRATGATCTPCSQWQVSDERREACVCPTGTVQDAPPHEDQCLSNSCNSQGCSCAISLGYAGTFETGGCKLCQDGTIPSIDGRACICPPDSEMHEDANGKNICTKKCENPTFERSAVDATCDRCKAGYIKFPNNPLDSVTATVAQSCTACNLNESSNLARSTCTCDQTRFNFIFLGTNSQGQTMGACATKCDAGKFNYLDPATNDYNSCITCAMTQGAVVVNAVCSCPAGMVGNPSIGCKTCPTGQTLDQSQNPDGSYNNRCVCNRTINGPGDKCEDCPFPHMVAASTSNPNTSCICENGFGRNPIDFSDKKCYACTGSAQSQDGFCRCGGNNVSDGNGGCISCGDGTAQPNGLSCLAKCTPPLSPVSADNNPEIMVCGCKKDAGGKFTCCASGQFWNASANPPVCQACPAYQEPNALANGCKCTLGTCGGVCLEPGQVCSNGKVCKSGQEAWPQVNWPDWKQQSAACCSADRKTINPNTNSPVCVASCKDTRLVWNSAAKKCKCSDGNEPLSTCPNNVICPVRKCSRGQWFDGGCKCGMLH